MIDPPQVDPDNNPGPQDSEPIKLIREENPDIFKGGLGTTDMTQVPASWDDTPKEESPPSEKTEV